MKRIPVIVAAETYKFCEKVQLDSIVYNELGSQMELVREKNIANTSTPAPAPMPTAGSYSEFKPELTPSFKGTAGGISDKSPPFQVINLR